MESDEVGLCVMNWCGAEKFHFLSLIFVIFERHCEILIFEHVLIGQAPKSHRKTCRNLVRRVPGKRDKILGNVGRHPMTMPL